MSDVPIDSAARLPMYKGTAVKTFLVNPTPDKDTDIPTEGLLVTLYTDGYIGLVVKADESIGFALGPKASLQLAQLILLYNPETETTFSLASGEISLAT